MTESGDVCLHELLSRNARRAAEAPAISAAGRLQLSYGQLAEVAARVGKALRASGFGREARVALVMDNGPRLAVVLLGVLASAAAAPLNPRYSAEEFEFYLKDMAADCLLTQEGLDSQAAAAAAKLGIPVLTLFPGDEAAAGSFSLSALPASAPSHDGFSRPGDMALLLHTSGTTSRPKLVPLTQANICTSAGNIAASLELGETDRYLNVMPLFHVHGMIGGLLASLSAGSHVYCSPGFEPSAFFDWFEEFRPTWYTAVPTMHQALLAEAPRRQETIGRSPLRFIRSCSAGLPVAVLKMLEKTFQAPVIEAYGMTEASHQMACNPLPPAVRKPGSVGRPTRLDMAILDEKGDALPPGVPGEVAIRGSTVMSGYERNPGANQESFSRGWFRTGDQGYFDGDGYLFLTGRIKEIINRGGEKISPREVDEVLLSHPAVAQAVAFAVPHPKLGEDVAAAVVRRPGGAASEKEIREFASGKLVHFKVPSRVIFLKDIPKGPTGKLQRIGLAKALGLEADPRSQIAPSQRHALPAPRTELEVRLAELFRQTLEMRDEIGLDDSFFQAGGDSLQATRLLLEIEGRWRTRISYLSLLHDPTVRGLAEIIQGKKEAGRSLLVPIRPGGRLPPLFLVHPHDGNVFLFTKLAKYLDPDLPLFAFQAPRPQGLSPAPGGIEELAERYGRELLGALPEGRYFLGGYCFGAWIALEMAHRLHKQGRPPECLILLDGYSPGFPEPKPGRSPLARVGYIWLDSLRRFRPFLYNLSKLSKEKRIPYLKELAKRSGRIWLRPRPEARVPCPVAFSLPGREGDGQWRYHPPEYPGRAVLFRPTRLPLGFQRIARLGWDGSIRGGLDVVDIPGYHRTLIFEPQVRLLGRELMKFLGKSGRKLGKT